MFLEKIHINKVFYNYILYVNDLPKEEHVFRYEMLLNKMKSSKPQMTDERDINDCEDLIVLVERILEYKKQQ